MKEVSRLCALRRLVALTMILGLPAMASAATPGSAAVSESSPTASWTGGPKAPTASSDCGGPGSPGCDDFHLQIVPPSFPFQVEIALTPQLADDWDLQVYGPAGTLLESSGNSPGQVERVILVNPPAGVYTVSAAPFAATRTYGAGATLVRREEPQPPPPSAETPPTYANYAAPGGMGQSAGEPTLGVNEKTGNVMYIAGLDTLRVKFDDCSSPARAKWEDASFLTTSLVTFDPILFTDQPAGRTFVSQLLFPAKQSAMAFSDDDGQTWTPSQGSGINCGVDHQAVGGGPFAPGVLRPVTSYPNAIYYCAQDLALAECAVSLDGGLTFGAGVPIYNLTECGGLHGHPKVAPDGTVYVPNKGCNGEQAVVVSTDSGLTWTVRRVPGSVSGDWDPSVAIAADGTVYFGFADGDGRPKVAVSRDRGETWTDIQEVGAAFGIQNTSFPVIVAGDADRAAFAFLGTPEPGGGNGDDPNWPGVWHLYVSHTYDGGRSWVASNATPDDPVQRGTICAGGIGCSLTRNLLDFMDVTVDKQGRVLVAYADGCTGSCVNGPPNSFSEVAAIARQATGKRLYAAYDELGTAPAAPATDASRTGNTVSLTWSTPDDHGSPITGYNVHRRTAGGAYELIATLGADIHAYTDTVIAGESYAYEVRAVNAFGEGPGCPVTPSVVAPPPPVDTCRAPGTTVNVDPSGDQLAGALDVLSLSVAEPATADGSNRLTFTLKVRDLGRMAPGHAWYLIWNRPAPDATADRNYVVMRATGADTAVFKYGRVSPPSVNQSGDLGDADGGSFDPASGTITIELSTAKADGVGPGQDLAGLHVRTFAANLSGQPVTQAAAQDFTDPANYTLVGNARCGPVNRAPQAIDDTARTRENRPVAIDVLANDSDPDGDAIEVLSLGAPAHGKVVAKKKGALSYKPDAGFTGADSFSYTIGDGRGGTDTATVTVTVTER
jgi:hypothetical protein